MIGGSLGSHIEGSWGDVIDARLTNSPSPFLVVLDEVGYYCVEGMAIMSAQAAAILGVVDSGKYFQNCPALSCEAAAPRVIELRFANPLAWRVGGAGPGGRILRCPRTLQRMGPAGATGIADD
jgi:hypothetical protein